MTTLEKKTLEYWSMSLQYNGRGFRLWSTEAAIKSLKGIVTTLSPERPLVKVVSKMYADVIIGGPADDNRHLKP